MIEIDSDTNILLLTVDCFRYDRFRERDWLQSVPGGEVVFDNCISTGPGTTTAFPGLLSSSCPLSMGGYNVVGPERTLLPEILKQNSYDTAGFHSNPLLGKAYGWDAGFDRFYDSMEGKRRLNQILKGFLPQQILDMLKTLYSSTIDNEELPYERAEEINQLVLDWLDGREDTWFCWAHYMDLHHPYLPPERYLNIPESEARRLWRLLNNSEEEITEEEVEILKELYDAEAEYLFAELSTLLDQLTETGALENTLVILTGDHGEEFREHGSLAHKEKLYDELIRVPLQFSGDVVNIESMYNDVVSHLDVSVSVLEEVGIKDSHIPDDYQGKNVFEKEYDRRGAISEISHTQFPHISIEDLVISYRTDKWKLIVDRQRNRTELYNLSEDPGEMTNLVQSKPDLKTELQNIIDEHVNVHHTGEYQTDIRIETEVEERLADLGYM